MYLGEIQFGWEEREMREGREGRERRENRFWSQNSFYIMSAILFRISTSAITFPIGRLQKW